MPIYEYRCNSCGHTLDALQKVNDAPLSECPECDSGKLRRLMSAPRFRLKGSGWYETDFKSDKETKRNLDTSKDDKPASSDNAATAKSGDGGDKGKATTSTKSDDSGTKPAAPKKDKDSGTAAA
jgi:putative FmdB family regulatory protein